MFSEGRRCFFLDAENFGFCAKDRRQIFMFHLVANDEGLRVGVVTQQHVKLVCLVDRQVGLFLIDLDRSGQVHLCLVVLVLLRFPYIFSNLLALVWSEKVPTEVRHMQLIVLV